jgi:probable F420-dependent oxidoreductase
MKFWCGTAFMTTTEVPAVAKMLDEAGFHGLFTGDHVIYPRHLTSRYPSPDGMPFWQPETSWPDTWVMIGAMAAVTKNLRFANAVYIAPARPILEVAKQVATASVISNGRVSLGVGTGWMREEFDLLGQDFDSRGPRLTEMIQALRQLWKGGWVSWKGDYYDIPDVMMEPHPSSTVPILCGGDKDVSLKRAAAHCDGWIGMGYEWDDAVRYVTRMRQFLRDYGRESESFEIIIGLQQPPSVELFKRAEELGVTGVMCAPWAASRSVLAGEHDVMRQLADRYREPIERFAQEILAKCQ